VVGESELTGDSRPVPEAPSAPAPGIRQRLLGLKYRNELGALLLILFVVQFLLPKSVPLGVYGLGVVGGASLALQAMGMVLVYRSNRFINFAQASIGMTAAGLFVLSATYVPSARWMANVCPPCIDRVGLTYYRVNYWVSMGLSLLIAMGIGYAMYALVVRRFEGAPRLVLTVAGIFIATGLPGIVDKAADFMTTRGQRELGVNVSRAPLPFDFTVDIAPATFHAADILTVLAALGAAVGLWAYFRWSTVGTAIRASAENPSRAETLGISVSRVTGRVWLIVGLLSGVGAVLGTASTGSTETGLGTSQLVLVLAVAVVARMTSLPMAALGAMVFGILRAGVVWSVGSTLPLDGGLVVVIGVVLLLQRYRSSRAENEQADWRATSEIRPIPQELRPLPTVKKWLRVLTLGAVATVLLYPWVMSPGQTNLGSVVMVNAMVGLSLLVLTGWAGQVSLGQFAFCAVGGYVTAGYGLPLFLALPAGAVAGAVVAVIVGLPALKLRGLHLAISTLAFALATSAILLNPQYLGKRLPTTLARPSLLGMDLDDERTFYYFTLVVLLGVIGAVVGLRKSRIGRVLIGARDNEQAIQSFGVNLVRARLTAFAISGFFAALAGGILAYHQHGAKAAAFGPDQSLNIFLLTVIGGLGSISGPIVGAVYQGLLFVFGASPIFAQLVTGFGGLVLLLIAPGGLAKLMFDIRDAGLRRIASRNRIVVASLLADRKAGDVDRRAPIAPKQRPGGGTVFVPSRYALDDQWALGVQRSIVQAGAVASTAAEDDGASATSAAWWRTTRPSPRPAVSETTIRRLLIPTAREAARGAEVEVLPLDLPPADPDPPRLRLRGLFVKWLRDADPRAVRGPKLPLVVISLVGFFTAWDAAALAILLPDIQAEFGLNMTFLLSLGSLVGVITLLLAIPMGFLADRVKRVRLIQVSSVMAGGSALAQGIVQNSSELAGSRAAAGLAGAIAQPAAFPLITDYYPSDSRARVIAFMAAVGGLGGIAGAPLAGRLADAFGWRTTLVVLGVVALAASLLTLLLKEPVRGYWDRLETGATEEVAKQEQKPVSFAESFRAAWSITTVRRLCYATPFLGIGGAGISVILALYYAQVFQLTASQRGNLATLGGSVGLAGLLVAGPVADRLLAVKPGRVMTLLGLMALLQCGALAVLAVSPNLFVSVAIEQPIAFVSAMIAPATVSLMSLVVPARIRGLGLQVTAPWQLVPLIIVPMLGGYIDRLGLRQGLLLFIPFIAVGAVIVMSAALGVERDIRAAKAASMADEEANRARASGRNKMIICRDVDVEYAGVQVLFGVDFDVEEGETIALLGTNGAGKSTLLRAIAGIQQASNGAIFLDGQDITHAPPSQNAANGVVVMPGGNATFPTLTVGENLRTAGWLYREDEEYLKERMEQVLAFFPVLRERWDQQAGNLSGGEQQMVGLSQAFLMKPRLLMIDELSLGLAPAVVERLLEILREIHRQGTTVILVEQSLNVALTIAERAVFMEKGQIRFSGSTTELLARPDLIRSVFMGGGVAGGVPARRRQTEQQASDLLGVHDIKVSFGGVHALRGASLDVRAGEIVGIIGPNGAGKTTLFDVISGFVAPDAGRVVLEAADVTDLAPDARARLGLGRSFQSARLFPSLTVRENIAVALERRAQRNPLPAAVWLPTHRKSEQRLYRRVDGLIELLGLTAFADKFVSELSTGTRRAVDVACIMAAEPKMLLLDEPSSGLAQAETEELGPVLTRVARETGCGMLVIEHDLPLVSSVSDRLVAMELGATIASGLPSEVVQDRRVLESYLSASEDVITRSGTRMAAIAAALERPAGGLRPTASVLAPVPDDHLER
jgi:ABC-type branched-subunit amino acid transport system ATPase component/ABC-type branched-subunit amino acid transport system permease subunit/MFS family permease